MRACSQVLPSRHLIRQQFPQLAALISRDATFASGMPVAFDT